MKRTHDTAYADNPGAGQSKRPKAFQACAACRRSKVRCESIDDGPVTVPPITRCRRCKTLNQSCSFETSTPVIGTQTAPNNVSSVIRNSSSGAEIPNYIDPPAAVISFEHNAAPTARRQQVALGDDPGRLEVPWGMLRLGGSDCLAAPVLALHIAVRTKHSDEPLSRSSSGESLTAILSEAQIAQLVDM